MTFYIDIELDEYKNWQMYKSWQEDRDYEWLFTSYITQYCHDVLTAKIAKIPVAYGKMSLEFESEEHYHWFLLQQ